MIEPSDLSIEAVRLALTRPQKAIEEFYPGDWFKVPPKPASVLIPFIQTAGGLQILYIRRTHIDGDIHSGQVAFPGGGSDENNSDAEMTALREAQEEIGVNPDQVKILGRLGSLKTISNYSITPIVAYLDWPIALTPSPSEVSRIFTIPLAWLADPSNRFIQYRTLPGIKTKFAVTYFQPYDREILWGATAKITVHLLEILGIAGKNTGLVN